MIERLAFYELIQTLKQNSSIGIASISELERAPPIKKKKKKKKKKESNYNNDNNENEHTEHKPIGTAAFLKLSAEQTKLSNMSSSQLLMNKHSDNKRKLNEMEDEGKQHRIAWKYREDKKYKDMEVALNDSVLFEWKWTKNVWKFANKEAFDEGNFDTFVAEELCGTDVRKYVWRAQKRGMHYMGCQVADCCKTGNMKIKIHVVGENPTKKQKT